MEAASDTKNMEGSSAYKGGVPSDRMTHQPAIMEKRKPRADAIRNRERVLEAAKAVFSQGGPEASLEAVARRAGVGIGTLYRHFPTREALYEAVYRHEVEQLVRPGQASRSKGGPGRGAAPLAASRRGIHGDEEGYGGGARHGRARFLRSSWPTR